MTAAPLNMLSRQLHAHQKHRKGAAPPAEQDDRFLTREKVARLFGVCTKTAHAYPLPWFKVGKKWVVEKADFEAWIERSKPHG